MATTLTDTPDRTADLAATGVPVLVAYGADDYIWLPAEQADMAARLGAAHAVIPGAAHSPAVQEPAGTVALLTRFWADPTSIVHEA
jgi:pimeloyl-ACP methyl ester carboxylesterase